MPVVDQLLAALASATVEIIDLTAPLEPATPVIRLPEPFGNTASFALHEISRYDHRGPGWPLPITGGSGSPARVLALVERP